MHITRSQSPPLSLIFTAAAMLPTSCIPPDCAQRVFVSCRPSILDAAAAAGVKISWHLEPYDSGRGKGTADEIKKDIAYINAKYRHHPACLKDASGLAVFFVYDSYRTPAAEWATLFTKVGVWHQQTPCLYREPARN